MLRVSNLHHFVFAFAGLRFVFAPIRVLMHIFDIFKFFSFNYTNDI